MIMRPAGFCRLCTDITSPRSWYGKPCHARHVHMDGRKLPYQLPAQQEQGVARVGFRPMAIGTHLACAFGPDWASDTCRQGWQHKNAWPAHRFSLKFVSLPRLCTAGQDIAALASAQQLLHVENRGPVMSTSKASAGATGEEARPAPLTTVSPVPSKRVSN